MCNSSTKPGKTHRPEISELNAEELDSLIKRLEEALEFDLALSNDDIRLLLSALLTLSTMQEQLSDKNVTLHKLRKLVGMVQSSEKLSDLLGQKPPANSHKVPRKKKPKKKNTVSPVKVFHKLDSLNKGDACPECLRGTLYRYEPAQLLRITGHSPYHPRTTFVGTLTLQRLRPIFYRAIARRGANRW